MRPPPRRLRGVALLACLLAAYTALPYGDVTASAATPSASSLPPRRSDDDPRPWLETIGTGLPDTKRYHLQTVLDALTKMGAAEVPTDEMGAGDWQLFWKFQYQQALMTAMLPPDQRPAPSAQPREDSNLKGDSEAQAALAASLKSAAARPQKVLTASQAMNHLPGLALITSKAQLWTTFADLRRKLGDELYNYVPEHAFSQEEWVNATRRAVASSTATEASAVDAGQAHDPAFGRRWVWKGRKHRGVQLITAGDDSTASAAALASDAIDWGDDAKMAAQYVEPLLVGGHKFDVGVYVAVTSVFPLRVYIHNNALLRVCKDAYPAAPDVLDGDTPLDAYVVVDYNAPWDNPGLRPHFAQAPGVRQQGTYQSDALRAFLDASPSATVKGAEFWARVQHAVVHTLVGIAPKLRQYAARRTDSRGTFFEMTRWDFVVDTTGKPWLAEVNLSPNVHPKVFPTGSDTAMKRGVVEDLLRMVFPRPMAPVSGGSAARAEVVSHAVAEWRRRGEYELAWPPADEAALESILSRVVVPLAGSAFNEDISTWREISAAVRNAQSGPPEPCGGCLGRGKCIVTGAGGSQVEECACEPGWSGVRCQISEPRGAFELPPDLRVHPAAISGAHGGFVYDPVSEDHALRQSVNAVYIVLAALAAVVCLFLRMPGVMPRLRRAMSRRDKRSS